MKDKALMKFVSEFREGILDGRSSFLMCLAVCAPLEGVLRMAGVESHAVAGSIYGAEHFWLEMADGRIIDPTADQFAGPPVYIGDRPDHYVVDELCQKASA